MMAGARPVFADIDPERADARSRARSRRRSRRGRARILPVHLYGQPADMAAIERVAARHDLAIVEDCCQAHLATCGGRPVGTIGVAGAFSFYPTKNLGALGDGGAVVTQRPRRWRRASGGCATAARPTAIITQELGHQLAARRDPGGDPARAAALAAALDGASAARLAARYRAAPRRRTDRGRRPSAIPGHVYHLFPSSAAIAPALQAHLKSRRHRNADPLSGSRSRGSRRSPSEPRDSARSRIASATKCSRCRSTRGMTPQTRRGGRRALALRASPYSHDRRLMRVRRALLLSCDRRRPVRRCSRRRSAPGAIRKPRRRSRRSSCPIRVIGYRLRPNARTRYVTAEFDTEHRHQRAGRPR